MIAKRLLLSRGPALVGLLVVGGVARAQHGGDVWVGRSAAGQLKVSPAGFVPEDNYAPLAEVNGPLLWGWSDNDPGFDHITADDPGNDALQLQAGAEIWLEVVAMDPALRMLDAGFQLLDSPGDATFLGDQGLHVHNTWHIDSLDVDYDPEQCVWEATFILRDEGGTGYAASEPFTFHGLTNIPLIDLDGDFDDDGDIDADDHAALPVCVAGPGVIPAPDDPSVTTCEVECLNAFDFDDDRDVDLRDFAEYQRVAGQ
ncbi:MAG: hypothetical protein GY842_15610 [bacterium]|nr:hypothetical protein [bacterium]